MQGYRQNQVDGLLIVRPSQKHDFSQWISQRKQAFVFETVQHMLDRIRVQGSRSYLF